MGALATHAVPGEAFQDRTHIVPVILKRWRAIVTPSGFIHRAAWKVMDCVTDGVNMAQIYAELA